MLSAKARKLYKALTWMKLNGGNDVRVVNTRHRWVVLEQLVLHGERRAVLRDKFLLVLEEAWGTSSRVLRIELQRTVEESKEVAVLTKVRDLYMDRCMYAMSV